jgi:CheY-like chemotaxis protein/predicted DNA-binding protein (UPF0251 family)
LSRDRFDNDVDDSSLDFALMISQADFIEHLNTAYDHLYDLVYLRTHPLTELLESDVSQSSKERAWKLHHTLINVIHELDPGPKAPMHSHEWRRYRLMELHYIDGLDPQAVAAQLAISRRTYYRELKAAVEAIATILWDRYRALLTEKDKTPTPIEEQETFSRLELLRLEAARLAQSGRVACLEDVIQGVLPLIKDVIEQRDLVINSESCNTYTDVSVNRVLLRQIVLEILGYFTEHTREASICLDAKVESATVHLSFTTDPSAAFRPRSPEEIQDWLSSLEQMGAPGHVQILPVKSGDSIVGFRLLLPTHSRRTVLVIDDNEDVLRLFQRYLVSNDYNVVTTPTASEAFSLAHQLQPFAITLDLMMPDQDGWEMLQTLLAHPETRHIPVIVCSVLKQKKLALSVGATIFLEKPVTEKMLTQALEALDTDVNVSVSSR